MGFLTHFLNGTATKIKDVKSFKKGCKKRQANCCATALGSGALVCQKVV
jgi:hypothetical protein